MAMIAVAGVLCRDQRMIKSNESFPRVKFSGIFEVPMRRVLFVGWSNSRNSMRLGFAFSDEVAALDQENHDSGEVV